MHSKQKIRDFPKISVKNSLFHIMAVGGDINVHEKWMHRFEDVEAVIFVASLSCFDELVVADQEMNAMVHQLDLFHNVLNNRFFRNKTIFLFLNKTDLFEWKLREGKSITECPAFADYDGKQGDVGRGMDYIEKAFMARAQRDESRTSVMAIHSKSPAPRTPIRTFFACATDRNNV